MPARRASINTAPNVNFVEPGGVIQFDPGPAFDRLLAMWGSLVKEISVKFVNTADAQKLKIKSNPGWNSVRQPQPAKEDGEKEPGYPEMADAD